MSYNIKDEADIVAATVGVEVHEIGQHPSGAYVLHTSVGKGYLPDDIGFDSSREALVEALGTTLQLMKDIADEKHAEPAVEETAEVGAEVAADVFAEAGSLEEQVFTAEEPPKPAEVDAKAELLRSVFSHIAEEQDVEPEFGVENTYAAAPVALAGAALPEETPKPKRKAKTPKADA